MRHRSRQIQSASLGEERALLSQGRFFISIFKRIREIRPKRSKFSFIRRNLINYDGGKRQTILPLYGKFVNVRNSKQICCKGGTIMELPQWVKDWLDFVSDHWMI